MKNSDNKKIEEILHSIDPEKLNPNEIENSMLRTWNKLSYSLESLNNKENIVSEKPKAKNSYKKLFFRFGIFILLVVANIGIYQKIVVNDKNTNLPVAQKPEITPTPTEVINEEIKKITPLAAARLDELQGVSMGQSINNSFSLPDARVLHSIESVFYYEKPDPDLNVVYEGQDIDWSKPIISESWKSTNYIKYVTRQDENILHMLVGTPEFVLTYKKSESDKASIRYFKPANQLQSFNPDLFNNKETYFLQDLIRDSKTPKSTNEKVTLRESKTVGNKTILIFDYVFNLSDPSQTMSGSRGNGLQTTYYFEITDKNKIRQTKIEDKDSNGKILYETNYLVSESIEFDKKLFEYSELPAGVKLQENFFYYCEVCDNFGCSERYIEMKCEEGK